MSPARGLLGQPVPGDRPALTALLYFMAAIVGVVGLFTAVSAFGGEYPELDGARLLAGGLLGMAAALLAAAGSALHYLSRIVQAVTASAVSPPPVHRTQPEVAAPGSPPATTHGL